jgi:Rrf2 family protein
VKSFFVKGRHKTGLTYRFKKDIFAIRTFHKFYRGCSDCDRRLSSCSITGNGEKRVIDHKPCAKRTWIKEKEMINNRTNYAILALCELAQSEGHFSTSEAIARAQGIPKKFLPQILSDLSRAGYVSSIRGFGGGVRLALPPEKITLLDIIEVIQGNILNADSLKSSGSGQHGISDRLTKAYGKAQEAMKAEFSRISIRDLISAAKGRRKRSK